MRRTAMPWLVGCLALTTAVWAQDAPPAGEAGCQVKKEEVKTWTMDVEGTEYQVHPATPAYDGSTGLFHMPSAYTLPKGKVSVSLFRDNLDRDPKDLDVSIHGLSVGFGATSKLEVFGSIGVQNRVNVDAIFQPGFVNDYPLAGTTSSSPGWQTGFGDVKLGAKYKFLDDYLGDGVGLAVRGYVKLPTADEAKGLGTGKFSGGADLVLSKSVNRVLDLHGMVGYQVNSDPDAADIGNAFRWGLGLNVPACRAIQLQADLTGSSYSGAEVDQTNPIDLVVGPVLWIKPGIFIRPALSWNLAFDDRGLNSSSKSWTGRQISIGYHPGTTCCAVAAPPPPIPPPANKNPTVACEIERSTILPGDKVSVRAAGSDPDGDVLTYSWSATGGQIVGVGPSVTYDSAGLAAPASATITVRAHDGRGGEASSTCNVNIQAPKRVVEPVTCTSGGFPRNMARLNNVDKACLDDVAARLKQDPRSRVVIVGHADAQEKNPEVIARKRGEAVKGYLVKERGIEESRIVVRSAGASKPLDTGKTAAARAKNRRVEVIFAPEGATMPEDDD